MLGSWPVITRRDNPGSYTVTRGGGYVANVGYMVARRDYAEKNPDIIERFLAARAEADQWVRKNANEAAEIATRWIPGTNVDVAKESMQFVTKMLDGRVSGCTVLGMQDGMDFTVEMRKLPQSVDVTKHVRAAASLKVEQKYPQFFADLPEDPGGRQAAGRRSEQVGQGSSQEGMPAVMWLRRGAAQTAPRRSSAPCRIAYDGKAAQAALELCGIEQDGSGNADRSS